MNRIKKWILKRLLREIGEKLYPSADAIDCRIFMVSEGTYTPEKMQFIVYPSVKLMMPPKLSDQALQNAYAVPFYSGWNASE